MGKVSSFTISWGYCFFNSLDHYPPHFHVESLVDDWEIRVMIETTTESRLDYNFKFPSNRIRLIFSRYEKELCFLIVKNRQALLLEWERKVIKGI